MSAFCEDDKLSHDCGYVDFCRFSACSEALGFCLERLIESGGDEGGHVECLPDRLPAAWMKLLPFHWPDWRSTGATPTKLAVACLRGTQFGHVGDDGEGARLAEPRNAGENVEAAPETAFSGDTGSAFGVDRCDLASELFQPLLGLALQQGDGQRLLPKQAYTYVGRAFVNGLENRASIARRREQALSVARSTA
ncbi:hypothetical protein NKH10_32055 [Mesorhizobium sp. M1340]|uniref:hypothetical protein n=1 Tax=Mesorhizobium sp. M1340 TaxID=2957087 RepID=UPI00333ACAB9